MKLIICLLTAILLSSCVYTVDETGDETIIEGKKEYASSSLLFPAILTKGIPFPIIAKGDSSGVRSETILGDVSIIMNRGYGVAEVIASDDILEQLSNTNTQFENTDSFIAIQGGEWPDSLLVIDSGFYRIQDDVTISDGKTVSITGPVTFIINNQKNIRNNGLFIVQGTHDIPVSFLAAEKDNPWGGFISGGELTLNHVILSGGGGNTSSEFVQGHSGTQAVVHTTEGGVTRVSNCSVVHNYGKGGTAIKADVSIDSSFFSFCDMGGEYGNSQVIVTNSHFQFFPNADTNTYLDDDNDCLYMVGIKGDVSDSLFSEIRNCYFGYGRDDGIDHNGSFLKIENVDIDFFENEGVACSNKYVMSLNNSRITRCEQAIEAGYGSPTVIVNHCEFIFNDIGIRFGDWYDWGCSGSITVNNSISIHNNKNVYNYDKRSGTAIDSLMTINYSIVDTDSIYNGQNNYLKSLELTSFTCEILFNSALYPSSDSYKVGRYE